MIFVVFVYYFEKEFFIVKHKIKYFEETEVVLVHSSLSQIGWINGGRFSVVEALEKVITEEGTIIMPIHSGDLSNPKEWQNPPVPESWHSEIIRTMPPFNIRGTGTFHMGKIPNNFFFIKMSKEVITLHIHFQHGEDIVII